MSSTLLHDDAAIESPRARAIDLKLEVVVIPVADVDRAKRFYGDLGWRLDADITGNGFRVLQFTPPGSPCSIIFGSGIETANYLIVSDIVAARAELAGRGVDVSEVYHNGPQGRTSGPEPMRRSYASWVAFSDPDGNRFLLQEVTHRLPGRVEEGDVVFNSSTALAATLRRAEAAHGEHEKRTGGQRDANWADWYADYIVREQTGQALPP
jgi:catechol 2,3-dioxygenase-like lactoylglutathione lyase family enzyme